MKMIIRALTVAGLFLFGVISSASANNPTEMGITFGVKNTNFNYDGSVTGVDFSSETGLLAGVLAVGDLNGTLMFRTGGYYVERKTTIDVTGLGSVDLKASYIEIPLTVLYKVSEMVGFFGGLNFDLKVGDSCSGTPLICNKIGDKVKSSAMAATVGGRAQFHPNWAGEFSYEVGLGDVAKDTSYSGLMLNAVFIY